MSNTKFGGFPQEGLHFFEALAHNNNREWFQAHKKDYQDYLQGPAQTFVVALGERLKTISGNIQYDTRLNGSGSIMRIYRDIRFSKDKTPYKTNLGIIFWEGRGKKTDNPGFYFHLDAGGAMAHAGMHGFQKPMLTAYRDAVVDESLGRELAAILASLRDEGHYSIGGEHYKRVPRGYDPDHKRADLLRHNGLGVSSSLIDPATVASPELLDLCFDHFQKMAPLQQWLVKVNPLAG